MHDCPWCGMACDCDGEDHWQSIAPEDCQHDCWEDKADDNEPNDYEIEEEDLDLAGLPNWA